MPSPTDNRMSSLYLAAAQDNYNHTMDASIMQPVSEKMKHDSIEN